jgi:GTPase Era involved in 16S rRNA processing
MLIIIFILVVIEQLYKINKILILICHKLDNINKSREKEIRKTKEDSDIKKILKILESIKKDVPINDLINILNNEIEYPEDLEKKLK